MRNLIFKSDFPEKHHFVSCANFQVRYRKMPPMHKSIFRSAPIKWSESYTRKAKGSTKNSKKREMRKKSEINLSIFISKFEVIRNK